MSENKTPEWTIKFAQDLIDERFGKYGGAALEEEPWQVSLMMLMHKYQAIETELDKMHQAVLAMFRGDINGQFKLEEMMEKYLDVRIE